MPNYEAAIPALLSIGVLGVTLLCIFWLWDATRSLKRKIKFLRAQRKAEGARNDLLS